MNFTREPIIETVITPREGCKLVVRSSKGASQEDYFVDAVEVVSFGNSLFFRSQERPKSFLVPVSDYEILELKETRMVLKNVATDRSIKIGGGREAPPRPREEDSTLAESRPAPQQDPRQQQGHPKRDNNRRRRNRRGRDRNDPEMRGEAPREEFRDEQPREEFREEQQPPEALQSSPEFTPRESEAQEKAPSFISKLFPPPTTLIRENLSRYKPAENDESFSSEEKTSVEETIFESQIDKELDDESEE